MKSTNSHILIIGAGPAGTATALFLAKQGIKSTILDKEVFPRDKICGDALSGKVVEVLKKLDPSLVNELYSHADFLGSYGVTFVAPNEQRLRVSFSATALAATTAATATATASVHPPGFISKRIDFDNWLIGKVKANDKIELYENREVRKYEQTADGITAHTTSGETFHAKIVIAADGAYSSFAKTIAGLETEPAHNCFGLRAYYKNVSGLDHQNFIELHFIKDFLPGYFWIFPLPNGMANVGVGMRADKVHDKKIHLKRAFEKLLQENPAISERFAHAEQVGEVKLFGLPLGSKKRKLSGAHYMLTGDAGMLIDPFTGEGIGNAMMSGMLAAQQAARCLAGNDFSATFMKQYDETVYNRLWSELSLSYKMQQLVNFPWLFNYVVKKANSNKLLSETISVMFEDIDLRARLKNPLFYFKLLFS